MKLSEHFLTSETACRDGCGFDVPEPNLIRLAEQVRMLLGRPLKVSSCCRCAARNKKVGGAPHSKHVQGLAMDFLSPNPAVERDKILAAYKAGELPLLGGLGLYDWGLHIDVYKARTLRVWDWRKRK